MYQQYLQSGVFHSTEICCLNESETRIRRWSASLALEQTLRNSSGFSVSGDLYPSLFPWETPLIENYCIGNTEPSSNVATLYLDIEMWLARLYFSLADYGNSFPIGAGHLFDACSSFSYQKCLERLRRVYSSVTAASLLCYFILNVRVCPGKSANTKIIYLQTVFTLTISREYFYT